MYEYRATVHSVYDADTVRLNVDLGFSTWLHRVPFRLLGIDAPELGTPGGREARDWLRDQLPAGRQIIVITEKDRSDKYGRWLAEIYFNGDSQESVNDMLIDAGHARYYDGGTR
jgi:micrococcal nuclease